MAGLLVAAVTRERPGSGRRNTSGAGYRVDRIVEAVDRARLVVMDAAWLEVVRERSQFLLLQFWRANDWSLNARPFLSLSLSVLAIDDARVRKVGATAILVGAAGLVVALIASLVGPVSVLLQGQAWRWVWVTSFAGVLLLVPTLQALWRTDGCGALCVLLVICGWTFSTIGGTICLAFALILWLVRRLHQRSSGEVSAWYGGTIGISLAHDDRSAHVPNPESSAGDGVVARDRRDSSLAVCTACPVRFTMGRRRQRRRA